MRTKSRVPISSLTTFQNEGVLETLVVVESEEELMDFLAKKNPFLILGKGSNTLLNPNGKIQTILQISPEWVTPIVENDQLTVGAGTPVNTLMKLLLTHELTGLEFSAGVPASVGGMIAMNFGCWGQEVCDYVLRIKIVTPEGECRWISKDEAQFGYRSSIFQKETWIITQVQFQLKKAKPEDIKSRQLDNIALRLEKQPLREKTFGSTFKNPEGYFAGQLIEAAGYKGVLKGDVMFSPRHANFLVNQGGGTFASAVELITEVQKSVWEKNKIKLETEVKIIP